MTQLMGTVQSVHTEQEGASVVLRFVVRTESDERIPVEMRGRQVLGILEVGDRVSIKGKEHRDKFGVMHLDQVENLATKSIVRVYSPGFLKRARAFVSGLVLSALTTVVTAKLSEYLLAILSPAKKIRYKMAPGVPPPQEPFFPEPLALLIGITAGVIVFYFLYFRRRVR